MRERERERERGEVGGEFSCKRVIRRNEREKGKRKNKGEREREIMENNCGGSGRQSSLNFVEEEFRKTLKFPAKDLRGNPVL